MSKNGTSNQGIGLGLQRLTSDNLSSIPRRNNILFLSDYLQEQHSHAKEYASEGLFSWNLHSESPGQKTMAKTTLDDFILRTPVLKPRAPPAAVIEKSILKSLEFTGDPSNRGEHASRKATTGLATRTKFPRPPDRDDSIGGHDNRSGFDRKEKPWKNKKRTGDERGGSDEEILKRLSKI